MPKVGFVVGLVVALGVHTGCILDDDVDDFDFKLPDKTFQVNGSDLGMSTVTGLPCDPVADTCGQVDPALVCDPQQMACALSDTAVFPAVDCSQQDICDQFGEPVYCDSTLQLCRAQVEFELNALVNLADEVPELREVGNVSITKVTLKSLYIDVQVNTFGVEAPEMGLYVAPQSVTVLVEGGQINDQAHRVGTIPAFAPNVTHVDVVLTTDGREVLQGYLESPNAPFRLFVYGIMEIAAGDPLPDLWSGQLTVVVSGEATASTAL